jgi:hypothetical protein
LYDKRKLVASRITSSPIFDLNVDYVGLYLVIVVGLMEVVL